MAEIAASALPRDVVDTVLGFARTLRHASIASTRSGEAMLAALGSLDVLNPTDVYWAGRLTLCGGPDDLDRYDAAFAAYFAGDAPRTRRTNATQPPQLAATAPLDAGTGEGDDDGEAPDLATRASADEVLRHRDVAELSVAEREHLRRLFALLVPATPMRPARRPGRLRGRGPVRARHLAAEVRGEGGVVAVQVVGPAAERQPAGPVDVGGVEHVE